MGAQLSRNKKDGKRHGQPAYPTPYPPYPYWPGQAMAVVPPGFPQPAIMPWPANHHTHKRRRKRTRKKSGRRGDHGGLPAGFVPTGFVSAPQAVVPPPGSMSRATSQGQPPPLFTPGPNNSQNLTSFPSPQIPTSNVGASGPGPSTSASRAAANRRAPTPFIPRQNQEESEEESDSDDSDNSGNSAPVIPTAVHNHSTRSRRRGGHRQTASAPTAGGPMLFQQPPPGYINPLLATTITTTRRPNPLPEPPRILFDHTPFKRLVDLPTSGPPYIAAVNPTMTTALTAMTAAGIPGAVGVGIGGEAGMAGMAGVGAGGGPGGGGTQKKKSRLMRAFSRRGSDKGQGSQGQGSQGQGHGGAQDYMASLIPVARVIPVVVADNRATASTGGVIPPPVPGPSTSAAATATPATPQPPLRYTHTGPYSSLSVRSAHPITYQGKVYPTAMHLFHAMEFMERFPETAEMIRMIPQTDLVGVFRVTSKAREEGKGRPEWRRDAGVFMPAMESVLYMKMDQHESVKRLLLDTGHAQLVFGDHTDSWWGDGDDGTGSNEMGKALMRVRDMLRERGYV